jgi:hypothetical protein
MKITQKVINRINNCKGSSFEICDSLADEDILILVEILRKKLHIQCLDLSCNRITEKGAIALASLTHLTNLDLSNNDISNKAVLELLKNKNLVSLNLSSNPSLNDELGSKILSQPIHHSSLKLHSTKISPRIIEQIEGCCKINRDNKIALIKHSLIPQDKEKSNSAEDISLSVEINRLSLSGSVSSDSIPFEESKEQSFGAYIKSTSVSQFSFLNASHVVPDKGENLDTPKRVIFKT